ncbi:MAG: hypothetical protein CBD97_01745 [Pelagibacteraceae bacterium TMED237]|nr:MAG: hypothetical protein CBD97_01745 [Pelagibacteraceae bacterium TMED237]|tara:strand:+ start:2553 stop:3299 length:747 start_codon:yes stop_codon:yes gene_type:complete
MNGEGERAKHVGYLPSVESIDGKRVTTYHQVKWDGQAWVKTGYTEKTKPSNAKIMNETTMKQSPEDLKLEGYGAPSLNASDFQSPDGQPLSLYDAVTKWKEFFPNSGLTDEEITMKVKTSMPQYEGVAQEEREFARQSFKQDMYGLQAGAKKAGQQMSSAYGSGMGSSIRGAVGRQKDVAQGFQQAEMGYEQDIYGLEKKATSDYESDLLGFAEASGIASYREGGKVPKKKEETFLDILSKLPDAGGM